MISPDFENNPPLILVADDEKTVRLLLRRAMEREGYRIAEADDGEQCLELCQQLKPDLVLLDAMMPQMDGFTCCAQLPTLLGDECPAVLMITVLDDKASVDRAFEVGAADYITKPINWPVLRQRVRRLLQTRWAMTELLQRTKELVTTNAALNTEITERQQAEDALRLSLATNRALIDAIPDWMFRISRDGTFVSFKAANENYLPILKSEFLGKNLCEVWPDEVAQTALNCVKQALSSGELQIFEYQMLIHDNLRDYEVRIAVSREAQSDRSSCAERNRSGFRRSELDNREEVLALVRDITERKRAEEDIRNALEKEKQLGELKSRFISMTSHEFRTPLATILSSAELLEHYGHKWTEQKKLTHLERIQVAVKHMNELLHDVLLIGKAEAGKLECKPTSLDLVQFCRTLVEEMQLTASTHTIIFRIQGESTNACMDEKLLRHILSNLVSNAIKYSPEGSNVYFDLIFNSQQVVFHVQDEGMGIPEVDQAQLFNSFYRGSNVGTISGTGLGLAIVKKSVDLHAGSIAVQSKVGVGTTFTVTLPDH